MDVRVRNRRRGRVCQGDVLRDVEHVEYVVERGGSVEISRILFPLVIVLTQDCDLEQESKVRYARLRYLETRHDKWLLATLVAPLYNAEHVFLGEHLSDLGMKMEPINKAKTPGKTLIQNERPRYHYLSFPSGVPIVPSVIDFKHYFSVNGKYLRKIRPKQYICTVGELFREDVAQRFAGFLSRIGLPEAGGPAPSPQRSQASTLVGAAGIP